MRSVLFTGFPICAAALAFCTLAGCSASFDPSPIPGPGDPSSVSISGAVMGGQQPVGASKIYMFAADTSQTTYGHASESLFLNYTSGSYPTAKDSSGNYYLTSDSSGNFNVAAGEYSCTAGQQVYLLAVGGNPGGGTNAAITEMAVLGTCNASGGFPSITTRVVINEVGTVAAAYALSGFATSPTAIASTSTALSKQALANAFASAGNLYNINTGTTGALSTTPNGNGTVPQSLINTLGNILAACVNSSGATSLSCSILFGNAGSGGGASGTAPTDTASAMLNIAHHPGSAVTTLYSLQGSSFPFSPTLGSAPNDFTVGIAYSGFAAPNDVAIDDVGSAWITGTSKAYKLSTLGVPVSGSPFTVTGANYVSVDQSENAYMTTASSGLYKLSSTGVAASGSPFLAGSFSSPTGVDTDGTYVYVANTGGNNGYTLSTSGTNQLLSPYTLPGCTTGLSQVAQDGVGFIWAVSATAKTACRASLTLGTVVPVVGLATPERIAIDNSANAWVANNTGNSITKITTLGLTTTYTGGGLSAPFGAAIDGSGRIWVANTGNNTVSEFTNAGVAVTSSAGFTAGGQFSGPKNLAIDPSGNVWVTNSAGTTVTELIGAATPVVTPLAAGIKNNTLGTAP